MFCFTADVETSFARQDKRARRAVCCCMCLAAMFLFVFMLPLFACPNVEYAKLCESDKSLCGETDRRTLCRDDISIFGAVIGERFAFLCGGERRCGLIVRIWVPVSGFVLRFACTEMFCFACEAFSARRVGGFCCGGASDSTTSIESYGIVQAIKRRETHRTRRTPHNPRDNYGVVRICA